jgi:ribose transport system substrate-binding protein
MNISAFGTKRRRGATAAAAAIVAVLALAGCSSASDDASDAVTASADEVDVAVSVRTLSNSYHANWVQGAELFAESVGKEATVLLHEDDSQRQLSQIKGLGAAGKVFALTVDPNASTDTEAIVRAVTDAGGYVVTFWNKPDDLHPWDISDNWVAHITFDGRTSGKEVSAALFDSMGGEGGVIALQGNLDDGAAKSRYAGLQDALAEAPGIELLDTQTAKWSRTEALTVTQTLISKYGDKIGGIWAANDEMALGALEALSAAGLAGEIPIVGFDAVPQALDEIESGDSGFVATVSTDAFWQGGAGGSLAFMAATGELDVASLPHEDREFNGRQVIVTADNVADFLKAPTVEDLQADFDDPYARNEGPIVYAE